MSTLQDLKVVEFATVGGVPHCAWLLAQHGAQVTRIMNPKPPDLGVPVTAAGDLGIWERQLCPLDLKSDAGRNAALDLIKTADVLLEGFRPGVMERLGLGPDVCHSVNTGLVYARLVGWDRKGPWAKRAGHDINYIAMSGALHAMGSRDLPINLVADIGGGALYMAFGIMAAIHHRNRTRQGSVVDTSMTAGSMHLMTNIFGRLGVQAWNDAPTSNVIDGGVPWYSCYETADNRHMAVGAIETRFYENLLAGLGFETHELPDRSEARHWPGLAQSFSTRFKTASLAHWSSVFESIEACVTPVLRLKEARQHPVTGPLFQANSASVPKAVPYITLK
ncbi:CaiB/BaiF CoA transferase family protein [Allopusillimonas ginsengisoli]|uniref:CaiB/BaiF CoA transferase family protein n=1 Tax=Allopusillimonas ginsengisoli TaxID=453575 RepID=UPI0010C18E5A|nr:CoA transferase [Allopusillimonas ginsengisoli]